MASATLRPWRSAIFILCLCLGPSCWPAAVAQEAATEALSPAPPADADAAPLRAHLPTTEVWHGDLDGMRKRRLIRILVPYSKTFYYIDSGGRQFGATYDRGHAFEEWLNKVEKTKKLRIQVVFVPVSRDRLFSGLAEGIGDIAAGNITITEGRSALAQFTAPFDTNVSEILVTGPTAPPLAGIDDLAGREIFVRPSSSYFEHLGALNRSLEQRGLAPIILTPIDEELEDEDIMEMVNAGLLPWAVVDDHKAKAWSALFTAMTLRSDIAVHQGGEIAWAVRKDNPMLLAALNKFVAKHKEGTVFGNMLKKRHFGPEALARHATSEAELKKYNDLIAIFTEYGAQYEFDALMIAAQGYQESKLNQSARSKRGAVGIMQMLPTTAADPAIGVTGIDRDAARNIEAGTKYLRLLVDKYLDDPAIDDKNRTLLAFAAYNAGPGNLRKFRRRAEEVGLDPNVWFGNVEHAAAEIVGRETVQYVSNIYKYYVAYRLARDRSDERGKARQTMSTPP
jgi:membrane-bound lytic murein transglycosylase MltF